MSSGVDSILFLTLVEFCYSASLGGAKCVNFASCLCKTFNFCYWFLENVDAFCYCFVTYLLSRRTFFICPPTSFIPIFFIYKNLLCLLSKKKKNFAWSIPDDLIRCYPDLFLMILLKLEWLQQTLWSLFEWQMLFDDPFSRAWGHTLQMWDFRHSDQMHKWS